VMEFPPMTPKPAMPAREDLVKVEPRLLEVERLALSLHPLSRRDSLRSWRAWERIKRAMENLVGWQAEQRELRHSTAYDIAYDHLLECWENGYRPRSKTWDAH